MKINQIESQIFNQLPHVLEALPNSIPEGLEVVDQEGNVVYVNDIFERISGLSRNSFLGKNIIELFPNGVMAKVLKEKKECSHTLTATSNSRGKLVANAAPIFSDGEMIGAVAILREVSEVIQVAKKLNPNKWFHDEINNRNPTRYSFENIIGNSKEIRDIIKLARKVARSDSTVLIEGENGTGKELFSHSLHADSLRSDHPFFSINCAAVPENLLESEFFGHEQGSFTGAAKTKIGIFELANGGTVFLDEIGDMALSLQSKLLRVLQEYEIRRVGGAKTIEVDVRIIAATNRDLRQLVKEGKFREDLYYRLNVISLTIPPLRRRIEDIPQLVQLFINKYNNKFYKNITGIEPAAMNALIQYNWPGNIRELENVIEFAVLITDDNEISQETIRMKLPEYELLVQKDCLSLKEMETSWIENALRIFGDSVEGKKRAADALGISLATLYNKLKKMI